MKPADPSENDFGQHSAESDLSAEHEAVQPAFSGYTETTGPVHAQRAVAIELARLTSVFQQSPSFLAVLRGPDNVFELVNPAYEQIIGRGRNVVGKPLFEAIPETRGQGFDDYLGHVRATGEQLVFRDLPVLLERTPGAPLEERFIDITYLPLSEEDGSHTAVIAHGTDVTDQVRARREAERLLRESEESRRAAEAANEQLQDQALELELANQQLQESASELEMQAEELQATAAALEERTEAAEAAQRDAEAAERRLQTVFTHAPAVIAVTEGPEHRFVLANQTAENVAGRTGFVGHTYAEMFPELVAQGFMEILDNVYTTGEPFVASEIPVLLEHGNKPPTETWYSFVYQPLLDSAGQVTGILQHAVEVTAQVRARAIIAQREREIRTLADTIPTLAWTARPDGFIDWYNARWYDYTGTTPEQMQGWGWQSVHDPASLPQVLAQWRASVASGEPFEMVFPLRGADGRFRQFLTRVSPVTDAAGNVVRWFGTNTDVDAERAARAAAEEAAERTRLLQALTVALAETRTVDDVAAVVVARTGEASGATTSMLALRVAGTDDAVIVRQTGLPARVLDEYQRFSITTRPGPAAECLRTGEAIFVEAREGPDGLLARFPEIPYVWESMAAQALATVPLALGGNVVGTMSFTFTEPRSFPEADRDSFLALAQQAAQAIDRARLLEAERVAVATLRDRDVRLNFALEIAALGAWDLDVVTRHAWRSLRHDQIFGYGSLLPDWTYDMFLEHVVPEDRARVSAAFDLAVARGTVWDFTCRIRRADGAERWIVGRGEPSLDDNGGATRLFGVVRDVTAEKDAEIALRNALDAAELANRAKSDFLASMSHELRTPLNAIGGYAELLALGIRGPVTGQQAEDLARIQRSQQHLLGLINDILNVVRLDSGQISYHVQDVAVSSAMARVEELILPQLEARGLAYERTACDPELTVRADEDKLRQVLVNLLSNATKFTESGCIDFWCDADRDAVRIRVRDTGTGIPADQTESIFEPFVQVGRKLNRPSEGVGLGLSISRDLARGMGGDLAVESTLGAGSTFTLTLPRA